MKNNHTKTDVDVEHHHKTGKQLAYTGLATVTLVSGMGATPIVLAETLVTEQTEGVKKDRSVDDNTTDDAPVITTPDALPKTELADTPAKTDDTPKVDDSSKNAQANTEADKASEAEADTDKNAEVAPTKKAEDKNTETKVAADKKRESKTVANTDKPKTVKAKESRAGYQLQASDFTISGTKITGFTRDFISNHLADWDGNLIFPKGLENIDSILTFAFCPGYYTFDENKILSVDFSNLSGLATLEQSAFYNNANLAKVTFSNSPIETIGDYAFALDSITSMDINNLSELKIIGAVAFGDQMIPDLTLNNLLKLETIKLNAFSRSQSYGAPLEYGVTQTVTLSNLPSLQTIGDCAFGVLYLKTLTLFNLPKLSSVGTEVVLYDSEFQKLIIGGVNPNVIIDLDTTYGYSSFDYLSPRGEVVPVSFNGEVDVATAVKFRDNINVSAHNSFTSRDQAWYINAQVQYNFIGPDGQPFPGVAPITKTLGDAGDHIRVGDVINGTDVNTKYTALSGESLIGSQVDLSNFASPTIITDCADGSTIDKLTQKITYKYDWAQALPSTVSNVDVHGNEIPGTETVTLTGTVNDPLHISQLTNSDPAIQGYDFIGIRVSTDNPNVWTTIDAVPGDGYTFGENAGKNYQFVYAKRGTVTQMYLDENNNHIVLADGFDHTTLDLEDGQNYDFGDSAPAIPGYGAGHWVQIDGSAETSGTGDGGALVVYYQYRTNAQPVTIYRVDTDGNDLGSETLSNHYIDEDLDLTPKQIDGYEYKHLFGSGTSITRVVPDLNWQAADELANTTLKYGDNAGRSYKFVYAKKATPDDSQQPEKPTTGTTTLPVPGENNKPATPSKKPATGGNTEKEPGSLPISGGGSTTTGGNKNTGQQGNNKLINTTLNNNVSTNTKVNNPVLPQSGNTRNYLLPTLGITLIAGILGLYAFSKKRKL